MFWEIEEIKFSKIANYWPLKWQVINHIRNQNQSKSKNFLIKLQRNLMIRFCSLWEAAREIRRSRTPFRETTTPSLTSAKVLLTIWSGSTLDMNQHILSSLNPSSKMRWRKDFKTFREWSNLSIYNRSINDFQGNKKISTKMPF